MRRTGGRARVFRAELLSARVRHVFGRLGRLAALAVLATLATMLPARGAARTRAQDDALARAAGNRRPAAVHLGEALFGRVWPVQILKVRVDGVGTHTVAGLVLSGLKFHRRLDAAQFTDEVVALVAQTFASSAVEEVDIWATQPLSVPAHTVVAGDYAAPTSRNVYSATVRRSELTTYASRLRRGEDVFWDPAWKRTLGARRS